MPPPAPAPPPAGESRDRITASDESESSKRARVRLELAAAYFGRGQMETALDQVKLALVAEPNLGQAHNLRGLIYASLGDERLAEESFRRALQINARDTDTMQNFGWYLCQQKRYAEAKQQFDQLLAMPQYRDGARTLLTQGVCHAYAGDLPEAERSLLRSYEMDPGNPATAVNLSEVLYRKGRPRGARAASFVASTCRPRSPARRRCGWRRALKDAWATRTRSTISAVNCAIASRPRAKRPCSTRDSSMSEGGPRGAAVGSAASAGALLRRARQAQGMEIATLAAAMKVAPRKLELLEADRFDELHDATFARALAQSVCRTLRVDAAPVMALLPQVQGQGLDQINQGLNTPFRDRPVGVLAWEWSLLARPVVWAPVLIALAAAALYFLPADWVGTHSPVLPTEPAASAAAPAVAASAVPPTVVETVYSAPPPPEAGQRLGTSGDHGQRAAATAHHLAILGRGGRFTRADAAVARHPAG